MVHKQGDLHRNSRKDVYIFTAFVLVSSVTGKWKEM